MYHRGLLHPAACQRAIMFSFHRNSGPRVFTYFCFSEFHVLCSIFVAPHPPKHKATQKPTCTHTEDKCDRFSKRSAAPCSTDREQETESISRQFSELTERVHRLSAARGSFAAYFAVFHRFSDIFFWEIVGRFCRVQKHVFPRRQRRAHDVASSRSRRERS